MYNLGKGTRRKIAYVFSASILELQTLLPVRLFPDVNSYSTLAKADAWEAVIRSPMDFLLSVYRVVTLPPQIKTVKGLLLS